MDGGIVEKIGTRHSWITLSRGATGKIATMIESLSSASVLALPVLSLSRTLQTHFLGNLADFESIKDGMGRETIHCEGDSRELILPNP